MSLAAVHRAVESAAARAAGSAGIVGRTIRVAGTTIGIRFAGDALVPFLFASLRHLETEPVADPDLSIDVWDAASTGIPVPRAAPLTGDARTLWREGPLRLLQEPDAVSIVDLARGRAACTYASTRHVPPWEVAAPFRFLFSSWFAARGVQLVHAGAVGTAAGAALLTAPGGSGKSATALGCLATGLGYLGDDFVLVGGPPDPPVFALYSVAKLDPAFLSSRLLGLPARVIGSDPQGGGKVLLQLAPGGPVLREAPARAIVVPRVGRTTRLRRIGPMDAFRAMAPTTALCLPGSGAEALSRMSLLVRALPCYGLELGEDPREIARTLSELLDTVPAHAH